MRPFDDVRVRRALNYAVDRRAVLRLLGGATSGAATCQIIPPNIGGYRRYCPYHAPELARALALVRSSGTRGMRVTVWSNPTSQPQARYARALLRRLGYRATLRQPSFRPLPTSREPGKGAQVGTFYWVADYPAASNFLRTVMACAAFSRDPVENSNPSQFCDRGIDAQMRRATALQATDPQRANELWAKIDREVVDAAPWVPLTNPKSVEILSARVGNYQFNPQVGSLLDQLWVRWPSRAASISNGSGAAPAGTTRAWSGQASRSAQPSLARRIRLTPAAPSAGGGAAPIHARARAVIRSR